MGTRDGNAVPLLAIPYSLFPIPFFSHTNCFKNRMSLSYSSRMSGSP
jgi:hypothetical protein